MLPDIIGYRVEKGISLLLEAGISQNNVVIYEYSSPKMDKIGNIRRILKVDIKLGKIILTVSNF